MRSELEGCTMTANAAALGSYVERTLIMLETNIDDMNPELFPPVMNALLRAGALDAWLTPIVMKQGRPAQMLSALCDPEDAPRLVSLLFRETSTLGVRQIPLKRLELMREIVPVETRYGMIGMKVGRDTSGEIVNSAPEFRDCERAAVEQNVPLKTVYSAALSMMPRPNSRE